jgi:NADH-quinone oxidoreductase subunit I
MRRANLLVDAFLGALSVARGMAVTLRNAMRPRVTEDYPARPANIQPRFNGSLVHLRDEDGLLKCTACLACQKACPTLAIPFIQGDEKRGRERRAVGYVWDSSRCLFCALCVEACPFDAIVLGQEYSIVTETREGTRFDLEQLLEPATGGRR